LVRNNAKDRRLSEVKFVQTKTQLSDLKRAFDINPEALGSGAFGKVYLATNKTDPSIKFAVKEIDTSGMSP